MAKKRKAKKTKIKRKRTPKKRKAKKPPASIDDIPTPVVSDKALENATTASKFTGLCA
jgi:hypothetical protein